MSNNNLTPTKAISFLQDYINKSYLLLPNQTKIENTTTLLEQIHMSKYIIDLIKSRYIKQQNNECEFVLTKIDVSELFENTPQGLIEELFEEDESYVYICSNCGLDIDEYEDDFEYCPFCGYKVVKYIRN